ncbi:MAG: hypothetical protein GC164_15850 [Phycisphaera sp.]|nr:hypothetical protein [Phycisphaera sp.]
MYAVQTLGQAYAEFPRTFDTPGNRDMQNGVDYVLNGLAGFLAEVPGGADVLYEASKQRFPDEPLPHLDLYMRKDPEKFGPKLKEVFEPVMRDKVIWQYVGENLRWINSALQTKTTNRYVDGLVDLYQKIGVTDYNWQPWGPARDKIEWDYLTFDPPEEKLWEQGLRYRPVTLPEGAQQWMTPGFDAKGAGWKTGFAPFAHHNGKLAPIGNCIGEHHFCGCGNPPNTFWDKEVLLMRCVIDLPAMKDDHAYRFLVGGRSHVRGGDGTDIWFNGMRKEPGKKSEASMPPTANRAGGLPRFFVIEPDLRENFDGKAMSPAQVVRELDRCRGTQFNPLIVDRYSLEVATSLAA